MDDDIRIKLILDTPFMRKILKLTKNKRFLIFTAVVLILAAINFRNILWGFYQIIDYRVCQPAEEFYYQQEVTYDDTQFEGYFKKLNEPKAGSMRYCWSYKKRENNIEILQEPIASKVIVGTNKNKDSTPQNTTPESTVNHADTYSGHCYEKRLPYKINVVYKEGYYDSDHTDLGMDGWEFICDEKVITHIAPMDGTRTITTTRPTQEPMYSDVPKLKQPEIKPIESHICKRVNPHLVKCGKWFSA